MMCALCLENFREEEFLGRSLSPCEKIYREFPVKVVQLILVFVVILLQEVLVNLGEVMKVEGTPGVDAFMDAEELPVFLGDEGMAAVKGIQSVGER